MGKLQRKTYHPCVKPDIADRASEHRWTCGECKTEWVFHPSPAKPYIKRQHYGFLGLRSRLVTRPGVDHGRWTWRTQSRKPIWVDVEEAS